MQYQINHKREVIRDFLSELFHDHISLVYGHRPWLNFPKSE